MFSLQGSTNILRLMLQESLFALPHLEGGLACGYITSAGLPLSKLLLIADCFQELKDQFILQ